MGSGFYEGENFTNIPGRQGQDQSDQVQDSHDPTPLGRGGQGSMGAGGSYNPFTGIASFGEGAERGSIADNTAWGGTSGAVVTGPDGKPMLDPNQSGRAKDVSRFRGVADAAEGRAAPTMDYGQGDQDRNLGNNTRAQQGVATAMLGQAASGNAPSGAVIRGQGANDSAFQSQLGAQAGARGGQVNQAAANAAGSRLAGAQHQGVASSMMGARSGELTSARGAYSYGTDAMRKGDNAQQSTDMQRQKANLENEMSQRELNQNRRLGYEGLAYDTNVGAMNAGLTEEDRQVGLSGAALQRGTNQADRMANFYGSSLNNVDKLGNMSSDQKKDGS